MYNRDGFENWITTRKLFTKYGAKLRVDSNGNYTDVRVNGHWITWKYAISKSIGETHDSINKLNDVFVELLSLLPPDCKSKKVELLNHKYNSLIEHLIEVIEQ